MATKRIINKLYEYRHMEKNSILQPLLHSEVPKEAQEGLKHLSDLEKLTLEEGNAGMNEIFRK